MSCVVGCCDTDAIWIGADSRGTAGDRLFYDPSSKVFKRDGFLFGCVGAPRMAQLLQYSLQIPKRHDEQSTMEYLVTSFADAVRGVFEEAKLVPKGENFLLAHDGQLFHIEHGCPIIQDARGYTAIGSGAIAALGALYILAEDKECPAQRKVHLALEASAKTVASVGPPFLAMSLGKEVKP